jgi:hypothetical protein
VAGVTRRNRLGHGTFARSLGPMSWTNYGKPTVRPMIVAPFEALELVLQPPGKGGLPSR